MIRGPKIISVNTMSASISEKTINSPSSIELTPVQPPANEGEDSDSVAMRKSTVLPINGDGETESTKRSEEDNADGLDPFSPESLAPLLSNNQFTVRKMAAQALMDVALMMANISQLRTLITAGPSRMEYYYLLVTMVCFSLGSQIVFAVLIFIIWMRESDHQQKEEYLATLRQVTDSKNTKEILRQSATRREEDFKSHQVTSHLNYITTVLVFIITVTNMFITGFGIKLDAEPSSAASPPSSGASNG